MPSPGYLPDSGIGSGSPALQADSLPPNPPGKSVQWEENKLNVFVLWADFVEMRVLSSNFRVSSSFRRKGKVSSVGRKASSQFLSLKGTHCAVQLDCESERGWVSVQEGVRDVGESE